jgi:hypothetical protein
MLTLQQLYNLGTSESVNIFEYLTLPVGSPFNKELVINTILVKCGLNIPMYADPYTMRSAIDIWSKKNQYTFEHIAKIYTAEYSPIENTDKYDTITVSHDRTLKDNTKSTNNKNESVNTRFDEGQNQRTNEEHSGTDTRSASDTTINSVSAENVSDYQPDDKSELTHSDSLNYGEHIITGLSGEHNTITNGTKNASATANNDKKVDEAENTSTTQHTHGNIGVTTNTTLQVEEYKLMSDYNPYSFIAGLFENELTLCVY